MSWQEMIGAVLRGHDGFYQITSHDRSGLHLSRLGPEATTKCISERAFNRTFMVVREGFKPGRLRCDNWGPVGDDFPPEALDAVRAWEKRREVLARAGMAIRRRGRRPPIGLMSPAELAPYEQRATERGFILFEPLGIVVCGRCAKSYNFRQTKRMTAHAEDCTESPENKMLGCFLARRTGPAIPSGKRGWVSAIDGQLNPYDVDQDAGRYMVICDTHTTCVGFTTKDDASMAVHYGSTEFCDECREGSN